MKGFALAMVFVSASCVPSRAQTAPAPVAAPDAALAARLRTLAPMTAAVGLVIHY